VKPSQALVAFLILALLGSVAAPGQKDQKEKEAADQVVDSGSFGIFMSGHRVGTETFSITQDHNGSLIKSEFKTENDPKGVVSELSSELHLSAAGDVRRYDWRQDSPERATSAILPNDQLLMQKWTTATQPKEQEQPYLLPLSTNILDDYFFVHREVLVWKFLAASCKQEKGVVQCPVKQRAQFVTLDPSQHASSPIFAQYLGREKISFKGSEREFNKIELKSDSETWLLWLDDQFKLVRIWIESAQTEVLRD